MKLKQERSKEALVIPLYKEKGGWIPPAMKLQQSERDVRWRLNQGDWIKVCTG